VVILAIDRSSNFSRVKLKLNEVYRDWGALVNRIWKQVSLYGIHIWGPLWWWIAGPD